MTHTILMGDPTHFSVVGGANPHTRDRWGRKKSVDRELAIVQWQRMRDTLRDLGLRVEVVPPDPAHPGLVYPANAGYRAGNEFILSNLTPTRAGEQAHYRKLIENTGLTCHTIESRFEGEADLFPCGVFTIFTHGAIEKQRFVPRLGIPPWKRIYGFRSDPACLRQINEIHEFERKILRVRLVDEGYYHGDTCLCSFGPQRRHLLAYLDVVERQSRDMLRDRMEDDLIEMGDEDAAIYAANSFAFERNGEHFLVMPEGVSDTLEGELRERGTTIVKVDVSEFYKKGGGSVKCMIGDLGEIRGS